MVQHLETVYFSTNASHDRQHLPPTKWISRLAFERCLHLLPRAAGIPNSGVFTVWQA